jgi:hypothetical protein
MPSFEVKFKRWLFYAEKSLHLELNIDISKTSEVRAEWKAEVNAALNLTGGTEES